VRVVSAHRTPDLLFAFAEEAAARGIEVIIAGAGGAAHLPGMVAAKTGLPVLGVPVQSKRSTGWTRCSPSCRCRRAFPWARWPSARGRGECGAAGRVSVILPGATIGILGGGQLGRMTAMAARPLGYKVHVLDPDPSCAARFVVERCLTAAFDDDFAAADLARHCAVVTLEIEKIAPESMAAVRRYAPVRPGSDVLSVVQDRGRQRKWLSDHGFPTVDWRRVASVEELVAAVAELGPKSFVKSCTGGYDGRGQARMSDAAEAAKVWASLGSTACVVERAAALEAELSVLVARTPVGQGGGAPGGAEPP
jgi:hypothetical protein